MSNVAFPRRLPRVIAAAALGAILAIAAAAGHAATAAVAIGFDTDDNPVTGCTLSVGGSSMAGVEVALHTVVTTTATTGTVGAVTRRTCVAGAFGAPVAVSAGGWAVGVTAGLYGSDLVETFIPLTDLGGAAAAKIGAFTAGDTLLAGGLLALQDPSPAPRIPIPAVSPAGLLLLLTLVGGSAWLLRRRLREGGRMLVVLGVLSVALTAASAYAILYDGNGVDWNGIPPLATDPSGDAPAGQDLIALYAVKDGTSLALRVDLVLARESANQAPVVSAGNNQIITLPATAMLNGSATDDGLPNPPAAVTTTWSVLSGPMAGVVFDNPAAPVTMASFQQPGVYMLRLTASDGALSSTGDVQITVSDGAPLLLSVADRTITLGTRFQQLLVAQDGNAGDTLTYALLAAPSGAALRPSPLVDWTPTAAQLGVNSFTAKVTDSAGHTAQTTFHVTVVHTNQPPQLAPQPNANLPVGAAFSRTLQASDPDAGDVLAFSVVSGPTGMTLTGATLNWPTAGKAPGDYQVSVKVADAGGLFDTRQFTVTLTPAPPPPVAHADGYEVVVGQTLSVAAAGVLANDVSYNGKPLGAIKLSDPDKGTLNAFHADGGFDYTAPAALPPVPGLNPVVSWRWGLGRNSQFALAADFDHDNVVDYVSSDFGNLRAWRGSDGSQLWQFDQTITTHASLAGCQVQGQHALGDVTGGGDIFLFASANCDQGGYSGFPDRYFAANASQILPGGKVAAQWVSPRLSRPHSGAYATHTSSTLPDPPVTPFFAASANGSVPTLAKLTAGGATKLLSRFLASTTYGYYYDLPNSGHVAYAACRTLTGLSADEGIACKATFIIDAATGAIEHVLTAPNIANERNAPNNTPTVQNIPIVADLDGDGQVEIVSGGDAWKLVGGVWTLDWQAQIDSTTPGVKKGLEPVSVAVADLDGDGKAEVILHFLNNFGTPADGGGIYIFGHDGTQLRKISLSTYFSGMLSVADVDGDGAPEILLTGDSFVYVHRPDGALLWAKLLPDITAGVTPAIAATGITKTTDSPLYVYDLDLDGVPEVIIQGTRRLFILNGRTGAELWSIDTESDGYYKYGNPLLVDADGDGHVDIIVHVADRWNCNFGPGTGPVNCSGSALRIRGGDNNWAPGPKGQNQVNFRPGTVNDAGQILYDGSIGRDFRQPIQQGTVIDPRIAQTASFTYKANDGAADSAPATVSIAIKPPNRPPVITSAPPTGLLSVAPYTRRFYTITATDPDPGDTVHYEFVASTIDTGYFPAPVVDPVTGGVDIYTGPCGSYGGPCDFGRVLVVVVAVDSHGARAEQSFFVDISHFSAAVPNVIGQLLPAARTAIEGAGLTPLVVTEAFGPQPAGTVIGQDPLAGAANIARSATVRLTVSKGPQPTLVPFVVGAPLALANSQLTALGFTVAVTPVFSTTIPVNQVMSQSPDAGTELVPAPANPVALTVSAGPPLSGTVAQIIVEPGTASRLAGENQQYKATAVLTDGTSADVTLSSTWFSTATPVATVGATGIARAVANGAATLRATLGAVSGEATLNVATRVLGDALPPSAIITAPADGSTVTGPVQVTGTAIDANFLRYEVAIALAGDAEWTIISEGTAPVANGALGTLDPTVLLNDLYSIRLTVFDRGGNQTVATTTVQSSGNRKVGLFSLTYQDLNVPAAGVPLTIHRTYDSRDKRQGDFGVGWRLGLQTLRLRTNRVLGTGWVRTVAGPVVSLAPTADHKVSVTLPDGRVEQFDMKVSPTSNIGSLDFTNVTGFQPRSGTLGRLEALANNGLLIVNGGGEVELIDDTTLGTYEPKLYRYTALDGTQIEISPTEGVKKVTDRNGNAVTFGPGGILHSDGRGIVFARDARGRIVTITDLLGNVQTYEYDGNGDLVAHTNPVGGVSRFGYDRQHGLIFITDATGNHAARNEYDAAGRLVATIDANGKRIEFAHDPGAQEELITDRLGNINRVLYDGSGNVLSSQQGVTIEGTLVAAVTTMSYDGKGNLTSIVDPDGRRRNSTYAGVLPLTQVVDPGGLALTTSYTHNARNDPTSVTDPGGRPFTLAYDGNGNLSALATPISGATTSVTNAQGQPAQATDALGTTTVLTRDAAGNIIREEMRDAASTLLRRLEWSYDANGNKLSETLHRTMGGVLTPQTTHFGYDAANRLTTVTDPLGAVTRTEYNAAGQVLALVDPLGRRTSFGLDAFGRRTGTTHPDAAVESLSYDANGNVASQTDAAGRTTTFTYDELNRAVMTTLPGGATTRSIYSAGGRLVATVDANGNRTDLAYDAAGRHTMTTLPAVVEGVGGPAVRPQVRNMLNDLGAPTATIDPLGRTMAYVYDAGGRLVRTTFADGTFTLQAYDVLGRRTAYTNEEGQTSNYSYDELGRLIAVSGHAGDATYAYDEAGNLLTQTDALGRVTRIRYDAMNRPVERQYPGGETERYVYDAAGNVVAATDANGRTTTFVRDVRNRMTRKNLPGGGGIDYAYAADGRRTSVTDSRGVTSYGYDSQGRLASVTDPSGATVGYTRDARGNLLALASPAATISYGYDALNRLVQATGPEGSSQYFYDLAGNRVRRTAGNGIVIDATFDARNRPTLLAHKSAGNAVLRSFANSYSPAGRQLQVVEQDGSAQNYGYDARGRLASEIRTGTNPFAITHAYNAAGNRTQMTRNGVPTAFTYDSNDRLLGDGTTSYAYDANGNLIMRSGPAAVTQFGYDAQNRLVTALGDGLAIQYAYDADGNRVLASNAQGTTRFLVAGANNTGLSQVLEERDGAGNLQTRYSYGAELLAMARAGNASFVHPDARGNIRALTDGTGAVTDSYVYDAYGNTRGAAGTTVNPYRYSGQRLDGDTDFYQMRARYYDPAAGRFISRDPFGGRLASPVSLHRYLYANADPVNNSDPTGQETLPGLIVAQFLNTTLENAVAFAVRGESVCNVFTASAVAAKTVFWGGLAASAFAAFTQSVGAPIKTAVSIAAINPWAIQSEDISAIEIRVDVPWMLAISASLANKTSRKISIGSKGFFGSASMPILSDNIYKCGVPIGSVALKAGVKAGANPFKGTGSLTAGLVAELVAFNVFRFEFPILELGVDLKDGKNDFVDNGFGMDLLGNDKGALPSPAFQ